MAFTLAGVLLLFTGIMLAAAYLILQSVSGAALIEMLSHLTVMRSLALMFVVGFQISVLIAWVTSLRFTRPVDELLKAARTAVAGFDSAVHLNGRDEITQISDSIALLSAQLQNQAEIQERKVNKQSALLQQQIASYRAAAEISQAANATLDGHALSEQVVDSILQRFNLYFVGLFLLDESREWAVLRSGTGEAGVKLLARGLRIRVGETLVGLSISSARPRLFQESSEDRGMDRRYLEPHRQDARMSEGGFRLAEELPAARSEAALPLRAGGKVIGALLLQSARAGAFDDDLLVILQSLADSVALAYVNARRLSDNQEALEASQRAYRDFSQQAWQDLSISRPQWGYRYAQEEIQEIGQDWQPDALTAVRERRAALTQEDGMAVLSLPILVRGQTIGVLRFRKKDPGHVWQQEEITTLETLAAQVGQAVESARLYQETQDRALRERLTSEVSARIRETLDLDAMLQTAVREVGRTLGLEEVTVVLTGNEN